MCEFRPLASRVGNFVSFRHSCRYASKYVVLSLCKVARGCDRALYERTIFSSPECSIVQCTVVL